MNQQLSSSNARSVVPVTPEYEEEGSLGIAPEDIRPPILNYNGKDGEFAFRGEEDRLDSFLAVPLRLIRDSRIKFNDDDDAPKDEMIECSSDDNIMPRDVDVALAIGAGPTCAKCQYSQFVKGENGKAQPPACTLIKNLAMASLVTEDEDAMPFIFSFKSTSIATMMKVLNAVELRRRRERRPGYGYAIEMEAGPITGEGKRKYKPLLARVAAERIPDEHLPAYGELWAYMRDAAQRISTVAADAPPADAVEAASEPVMDDAVPAAMDEPVFDQNGEPLPEQKPVRARRSA